MSKRKGISADEKKVKVLEIFQERKDVFQLKELEKLASKEKKINSMLVKDIVQSLVDDSLVDTEKIGSSNYFWAFPSKIVKIKQDKLDGLKKKYAELSRRLKSVDEELFEYEISAEEEELRKLEEEKLKVSKDFLDKLRKEVNRLQGFDPDVFLQHKEEIGSAREATNRWTDNVMTLKSYCKDKAGMESEMFHQHFNIPEEIDYVE